jgi:hypothetical protein
VASIIPFVLLLAVILFIFKNRNGRRVGLKPFHKGRNRNVGNQRHLQHIGEMQRMQFHQFMEESLEESRKLVTPIEHGGYVQDHQNRNNGL